MPKKNAALKVLSVAGFALLASAAQVNADTANTHQQAQNGVSKIAVNKAQLLSVIRKAQGINGQPYTQASYNRMQEVLANVVNNTYHNANAPQAQVNDAASWLNMAIAHLVPKNNYSNVNKVQLLSVIRKAQGINGQPYTQASFNRMQEVLANVVNNTYHNSNAPQAQVNDAASWLNMAIAHLVKAPQSVNKAQLLSVIRKAQGINGQPYTQASYNRMQEVLANVVNNTYHNANAPQAQVNDAASWLNMAIAHLVQQPKAQPVPMPAPAAPKAPVQAPQQAPVQQPTEQAPVQSNGVNKTELLSVIRKGQNIAANNNAYGEKYPGNSDYLFTLPMDGSAGPISILGGNYNYYTFQTFSNVLADVINNTYHNDQATQEQVNNATQSLNSAIGQLVDQKELNILTGQVWGEGNKGTWDSYTVEQRGAIIDYSALAVQKCINKEGVTQAQVDFYTNKLNQLFANHK